MEKLETKTIVSALEKCIDPELGKNIVDLGFIYGILVNDGKVQIKLSLTSPMCPAAGQVVADVKENVGQVKEVTSVDVEMVWDPPWTPELMSDEIKAEFG